MARPRKGDDEKRKLLSIRLDASDRAALDHACEASGRSAGAEAEKRITATLGLDDRGLDLVAMLAGEIRAIEQETGKQWHADQRTWFAVSELMSSLPPHNTLPHFQDEDLEDANGQVTALCDRRRSVAKDLETMGLAVPEFPDFTGDEGFLGDTRAVWRQIVEASKPSSARDRALALLDQLTSLDAEIEDAAREAARLSVLPIEEGEAGRALYRRRLQAEARRKRAEGAEFNPRHLVGDF